MNNIQESTSHQNPECAGVECVRCNRKKEPHGWYRLPFKHSTFKPLCEECAQILKAVL